MLKIGIVGLGFVGGAIKESFGYESNFLVLVDNDPSRGKNSFEELANTDAVFVCVPTPQDSDGTCDTGPLESVLAKLKETR